MGACHYFKILYNFTVAYRNICSHPFPQDNPFIKAASQIYHNANNKPSDAAQGEPWNGIMARERFSSIEMTIFPKTFSLNFCYLGIEYPFPDFRELLPDIHTFLKPVTVCISSAETSNFNVNFIIIW